MVEASVVIPTYNRSQAVTRLVRKLCAQHDQSARIEIVVVVDGSTDDTVSRLKELQAPAGIELRVIAQANKGRAAARNAGIREASAPVLIFLDDDVLPGTGLIRSHLRALQTADLVLGRIEHGESPGEVAAFREQSVAFYRERHARMSAPGAQVLPTDVFAGNMSVRSSLLHSAGGFDEAFSGYGCEDWDLGKRLMDVGAHTVYSPDATVVHVSVVPYRTWLRNAREEAISQIRLVRKHPTLARHIELGGLNEATLPGRLIAKTAIAVPHVGNAAAVLAVAGGEISFRLGRKRLSQRMLAQSSRLAFWSSVRTQTGSATDTLRAYTFPCRILCYHRVHDDPNPALAEWAVASRNFERQMGYLRGAGFQTITIAELVDAFASGRPLWKTIAITFDDGYADTADTAAPIMKRHGYRGTVYVVTGRIGQRADWDTNRGGEMAPLATRDALRQLAMDGWELGHHTVSHPDLRSLDEGALAGEISGGRSELAPLGGCPVRTFAYPFGSYDLTVRDAVERAGYAGAVILGSRCASPRSHPFALERVMVRRDHSLIDLRLLLWFGLDRRELARHVWTMLRPPRHRRESG